MLAIGGVGTALVLGVAGPAVATPAGPQATAPASGAASSGDRAGGAGSSGDLAGVAADIAAAQAQMDALDARAERLAEQMNGANVRLEQADADAQAADQALRDADARVAAAQQALAAYAASAYRDSGLEQLRVFTASSPQEMLDRHAALSRVSQQRADALREVTTARAEQARAQEKARQVVDGRRQAVEELAAAQEGLRASATAQQATLDRLRARQADLVRQREQEAARAAAAQKAAADAALAAAQARQQEIDARAANVAASTRAVTATPAPRVSVPAVDAPGNTPRPAPPPRPEAPFETQLQMVLSVARAQIGKPYAWAGAGPDSFDCSGLTAYAYRAIGISLPHYTGDQWNMGRHVDRSDLRPGDLVFFGPDHYHVGIYVGNNQMIDAPRTGTFVRTETLWGDFSGAVRLLG